MFVEIIREGEIQLVIEDRSIQVEWDFSHLQGTAVTEIWVSLDGDLKYKSPNGQLDGNTILDKLNPGQEYTILIQTPVSGQLVERYRRTVRTEDKPSTTTTSPGGSDSSSDNGGSDDNTTGGYSYSEFYDSSYPYWQCILLRYGWPPAFHLL